MSRQDFSPARKGLFYFGLALAAIGIVLFLSTFVSDIIHFGDFSHFDNRMRTGMATAFGGIISIAIGMVLMMLGRFGLAGSGLKLDPDQARRDQAPWSRMAGGIIKDVLDEADVDLGHSKDSSEIPFDEKLRRLESLKHDGLITEDEFRAARQKILDGV